MCIIYHIIHIIGNIFICMLYYFLKKPMLLIYMRCYRSMQNDFAFPIVPIYLLNS